MFAVMVHGLNFPEIYLNVKLERLPKMKSIVTITFNPAIDKSTTVDRLIPEHKMKTSWPLYQPGGGGVNIARALKKLGFSATAVYFAGGNEGKFYSNLLAAENVNTIPIVIQGSTRENFIVNELSTGKQFRFGLPGPVISPDELELLLNNIKAFNQIDYLVVSGSIPDSIPLTVFEDLKAIAVLKKASLVVDSSGAALKSALAVGVYLIKPSLSEMAELAGRHDLNLAETIEAARGIVHSGKCKIIMISMGAEGAVLVSSDLTMKITPPQVSVVSTVGAGDSMLAGFLFRLAAGEALETAFGYGIACGTAATTQHGTGLCEKDTADELFSAMTNPKDSMVHV